MKWEDPLEEFFFCFSNDAQRCSLILESRIKI